MKKRYILTFFLFVVTLKTNAQWLTEASGFSSVRDIAAISIASSSISWAVAINPAGTPPVQEYTKTINGGTTWTPGTISTGGTNTAAGLDASNIFAADANTAWVSMFDNKGTPSLGGGIFKTTDGGTSWVKQTSASFAAPNGTPNFIYFFDANNGVCGGDSNTGYWEIYTTTNGGTNWTRVPSANIPANLTGEAGNTNTYTAFGNTLWFGTSTGRIYKSTDKGLTWTVASTPYSSITTVKSISFKDANNGLALGDDGTINSGILKTSNGGGTWTMQNSGITGGIDIKNAISYLPGSTGTYVITGNGAAGSNGSAYSTDNGLTWTNLDAVPHIGVSFFNSNPVAGWSGSTNTSSTSGGIFKWTGIPAPTAIFSYVSHESISVFPNPGNGLFKLEGIHLQGISNIKIYDCQGKEILSGTNDNMDGTIDLRTQPNGIYYIVIQSEGKILQTKIILQK